MDQRLQKISNIKLHYRHGKATLTFISGLQETIHSYEKPVDDLYEVFILYRAYERFVGKMGWHLIAAYLASKYGISTEEKSFEQVVKEIGEVQQKTLKEMEEHV